MSRFLSGKMLFSKELSYEDQKPLSQKIVKIGIEQDLYFHLGCNLVQKLVFEMLREKETITESGLIFLLTDSPISNVSDDLIFIDTFEIGIDKALLLLKENLDKIKTVLDSILKLEEIKQIIIYFSDRDDISDDGKNVSSTQFVEESLIAFRKEETEVPSLKFIIDA